MPCTTILVGKKASFDGSTIISRNDDGQLEAKRVIIVEPNKQPRKYKSVISHVEIDLPDNPLKYSAVPDTSKRKGIWAASGINELNVGITATETITSNPRVLGADPYVVYKKAKSKKEKDIIGGIGEEDIVTITLPYIKSARDGVLRLGKLLEQFGTYEPNGIAFSDENEVWWFESIGGHHWIASKVPDDKIVIMPNQFGTDNFDLDDALGKKINHMCSSDLKEFIEENHLNTDYTDNFNPRHLFGSNSDQDHIYNTPRAWYLGRYFAPRSYNWEGGEKGFSPISDDIPWSLVPEKKVTIQDIKYVLSSHYQGTPYDPYDKGQSSDKGRYRSIGVPNTDVCGIIQIRGYMPNELKGVQWLTLGGQSFTCCFPVYSNCTKYHKYISETTVECSTNYMYWASRIIAALVDAHYGINVILSERYVNQVFNKTTELLYKYDKQMIENKNFSLTDEANDKIVELVKEETNKVLTTLMNNSTNLIKTRYKRDDN